ncbi:hypothetical protein AYO21_11106 [Fonsecaea monophora]|uniref:Oxidase ustYa n=1 Tax=Fonsecaea monophora TaxID=254056 RepID=A0A177ERS7_9EURO|nr:hypothetical protein AYO21_11106 [Fonsecaea monophora]OAG34714.1 hypothetical protein AYO21_11106 [Fonsecaea monophora]
MSLRADESTQPMLSQYRMRDVEEDIPLDDNESDVTRVAPHAGIFGKMGRLRARSPSDMSTWSYNAPNTQTRRHQSLVVVLTWFRWGMVILLQTIILVLLWRQGRTGTGGEMDPELKGKTVETGGDINGLYKTTSHSYTFLKPDPDKFIPNMTSNDNRLEVRRNWDLLMPLGSGSVAIPDYRDHPLLGDPITDDPIRSGPLFEASWTHALHCKQLYYTMDSYHQLIVNGRTDNDNPYHAAHCFEYLRNSILCNLDMTLEGSMSTPDDKERGQPHVCRNREEAIAWIEARRVDDLQDIVGP